MNKLREQIHPYQVMDVSEMAIGSRYVFVLALCSGSYRIRTITFAGIVTADGCETTLLWGQRLGPSGNHPFVAANLMGRNTAVAVHMDGWAGMRPSVPSMTYWTGDGQYYGWDKLASYTGRDNDDLYDDGDDHRFAIVPENRWLADPNLRWDVRQVAVMEG